MERYSTFSLLLVAVALFAYFNLLLPAPAAHHWADDPDPALLAGFGRLGRLGVPMVLRVVEVVPGTDFYTVLMQYMLSFPLFTGAMQLDMSSLGRQRVPVVMLATLGTLISTVMVACGLYLTLPLFRLPLGFIYCLLLGSLISPTDPVAVLGILTKASLPKALETEIVGESLFNDGVGVVLFATVLSVAVAGPTAFDPGQALVLLMREGVGGLVLGYAGFRLLLNTNDYRVEAVLTLALVTGGSALAARLHTSGPGHGGSRFYRG